MFKILITWSLLTGLGFCGVYYYLELLPMENFDVLSEVQVKVAIALVISVGIALAGLFLFLFFGSILRSQCLHAEEAK